MGLSTSAGKARPILSLSYNSKMLMTDLHRKFMPNNPDGFRTGNKGMLRPAVPMSQR